MTMLEFAASDRVMTVRNSRLRPALAASTGMCALSLMKKLACTGSAPGFFSLSSAARTSSTVAGNTPLRSTSLPNGSFSCFAASPAESGVSPVSTPLIWRWIGACSDHAGATAAKLAKKPIATTRARCAIVLPVSFTGRLRSATAVLMANRSKPKR